MGSGVSVTICAGNVTERFKQTAELGGSHQRKQESESEAGRQEGGVKQIQRTHLDCS